MRKEINEQLTLCALKAAEKYLVSEDKKYQLDTMYPKTAEMGPMILRSGLLPAVSNYEEDRPDASKPEYDKNYKKETKNKCRVNDAVYATLESFVQCPGVNGLWTPDETLKAKIDALQGNPAKNKLLLLVSGLTNVNEYMLVREYVLQSIVLLKLALNTYPEKENNKGGQQQ